MMSHRGKRQALSRLDEITAVATKRRKGRAPPPAEEEETSPVDQRQSYSSIASDMKMSSIYNRSVTDAPAELFRKDLISAMKLPDSEPLTSDHYWVITDQWKQEWEKGVQVPVKPDSLPGPVVALTNSNVNNSRRMHHEFKLPKKKYIRITKTEHFSVDEHYLSNVSIQAEKCCAYDLEDVDVVWLNILNGERALMGLPPINQDQLERVIEELEMRCWEKVHAIVKKEEGLALEFDESVICDVCRSPDSEDGNEMVFCDCCNICVHQACYGITSIPSGQWLCRTCNLGLRPECVLCPNKNGAMKSTRTGQKWAHVSCALWIPEVSIGCVEKMEPITKISSIPQSRWALICVLCRERVGACIQCSVKTCKTAYHVTCAFKHGLEMRAIIDEENTTDDDNTVKLRSYCQKHSITSKNKNCSVEGGSDEEVKKKLRKDMTTEEKSHARAVKLQEIEAEFEKHVSIKDITRKYDVDQEGLEYIYNYWVLKRRAAFNKPLLSARSEDASDLSNKNQEQVDQEKMRMFVQLRQDLERVRNLCYMVTKREKLFREYIRTRHGTFTKQTELLSDPTINLSTAEITSIKEANHGPSIYDRLYSHPNAPDLSTDFDTMVRRIAGRSDSELSPGLSLNGYVSGRNGKRSCFNGDICKPSSFYESLSSSATSDIDSKSCIGVDTELDTRFKVNNRMNKSQRKNNVENRIKNTARRRKKTSSALYLDSTTSTDGDDDVEDNKSSSSRLSQRSKKSTTNSKKQSSASSRSFELLENRILGSRSCSVTAAEEDDSEEELFLLRNKTKGNFKKNAVSEIYSSDTDSSCSTKTSDKDRPNSTSKPIRTKASVKEFSASGGAHRSSKEHAGSNGLNKSVTFSSSSKTQPSSASTTDKRKRVNKLFDEESDDTTNQEERKNDKEDKLSTSESEFFIPQKKTAKAASESRNKSCSKGEGVHVKSESDKKSSIETASRKMIKKDSSSAETDLISNDDKNSTNAANYDMLTLVPQRAAAKKAIKAIEHIKNGMVKPPTVFEDPENDNFRATKAPKLSKKDHISSTKQKTTASEDVKLDNKVITSEKRTSGLKSSILMPVSSTDSGHTSAIPVSVACSTSFPTSSSTTTISNMTNASISHFSSSTTSSVVVSAVKETAKKPTMSSSGSSSGSSTGGSSSSSSSCSSSSSSSSSSSDSSSSAMSSSSSSDSEGEDASSRIPKKLPGDKTVPASAAVSISVNTPIDKPIPESKERKLETTINIRNKPATKEEEGREDNKPLLISRDTAAIEQKSKTCSPEPENRIESYSMPDNSSCIETKAAVEHLTSNEQNFLLSPRWESTTSLTATTSVDKDEIKMESNDDDGKKEDDAPPLLSSLPSRSLFSPQLIKDIDLSTFDDVENDINENNNLSDTIASFAFSFGPDLFKEETKEDSSRETYNLVEKLKLEMARKKNHHSSENLDCMASAPTPDVVINHVADEDEEKENNVEKLEANDDKLHESMSSLSENSQNLVNTSSESSLMLPADEGSQYTDKTVTEPADLKSPSVPDLFTSCPFPSDVLQPVTNSIIMEKESVPISESCGDTSWVQSSRRYDEPDVSSPYHQEMQNTDRWADSVMMPSRRSDCSSISISSQSSSSSMYSEHHQQTSNNDEVSRMDYVPTVDMSQHMQKTVTDSLRPPTTLPNDNPFAAANIHDNMYSYQEHLPFVKTNFNSTTPISDKSLYSHSPQQVTQSSSLFSTPMNYDSVSTFNNSTFPPLSIQTPFAATASFTTTSQNMAIITSIISPVPPPPSEDAIAATPTSEGFVKIVEKFVDMTSEPPAATVTAAAAVVVSELTNEALNNAEKIVNTCSSIEDSSSYSADKEKENLFANVADDNETSSNTVRPLTDKNEIVKKIDFLKSTEPVTVTTTPSDSSAATNNQIQVPPKTQLPAVTSKKSPGKPTRMSARVISQNKSPAAKSPIAAGVSPARLDSTVNKGKNRDQTNASRKNHRTNNKGTGARRGGRGRGRGRNNCFYRNLDDETITSKLVGTVYDFDDEDDLTGDNFENLRAMRERRKSTDTAYCDRLSSSSKDTCYSPKFASPSSQPPSLQQSKRKGSLATTPDRRSSHRSQLSPLCEISNNSRILPKDLHRDTVIPLEDDDEEEEDEDEQGEEEDDDDENSLGEKKSTSVCGSGGKSDRNSVSTSSPTLPQPPVQSSAVEQFAAVQPLLPGPVDMRTYSGDNSYESETHVSTYDDNTNHNDVTILPSTLSPTNSSNTEPLPDIVDALEMEIQRYSILPVTGNRSSKSSPAVTASPRVLVDSSLSSKLVTHNQSAVISPSHFLVNEQVKNAHVVESSVTLLDDDNSINRNQLRMKIKGPYSDANYVPVPASVSTAPIQQLPPVASSGSMISSDGCYTLSSGVLNTSVSSAAASSSNLRRMRKKELLRQYWAQDENTDQCGNDIATAGSQSSGISGDSCFGPASNTSTKVGLPGYKLPKAVASMPTIPTKEDYKEVLGAVAYFEKKKRGKDKTTVMLDAADISNNNANAANSNYSNNNNNNNNSTTNNNKQNAVVAPKSPDKKSNVFVNNCNNADDSHDSVLIIDNHAPKRKSRGTSSSTSTHPKLKIKIGGVLLADSSAPSVVEEKNMRLRPPKKRLCDQTDVQPPPVVYEQLRKLNMKFRSKVASEFNENGDRYEGTMDDFSDEKSAGKEERSRRKRKKSLANASGQKSSKRKKKQQRSPSRSSVERSKDAYKDKIQVISRNVDCGDGGPKKIVIKIKCLNSPVPVCESSPPPPPSPAKPPKSSKRNRNHELDSVRTDKITPIRLKLSRSNKGYVSKSSCVDEEPSLATSEASSSMLLPKHNVVQNAVSHAETATPTVNVTTSAVEPAAAVSTSETS